MYDDDDAEFIIPGADFRHAESGGQPRPTPQGISAWKSLTSGRTIGKSVPVRLNALTGGNSIVDILEIGGEDNNAVQLSVTLGPALFNTSTAADPNTVNSFQSNREIAGGETIVTPSLAAFRQGNVIALISWGCGGQSYLAEVDFQNGCSINLGGASWVRIRAVIGVVDFPMLSGTFLLSAFINPGAVRGVPAQRTFSWGSQVINTESFLFAMPSFAKTAMLIGLDNSGVLPGIPMAGALRFYRGFSTGPTAGFAPICEYRYTGLASDQIPVPIPNGAQFFTIISHMAVQNLFNVIIGLSI